MTNQVFTHPGQPQMQVEVILASRSTVPGVPVIYTIRMRYPRIIHGEIMTHRVFSRNARSSRAVPVRTMLLECTAIPFIPWHWGKNQKGMQAGEEFTGYQVRDLEAAWLNARTDAAAKAELLMSWGVHKQIPNRLLEPFSWIDTLITSTDWENFLWLRDHKDAEPHLQDLARLVKKAIDAAEVATLEPGQWHQPYVFADDYQWAAERFFGEELNGWIWLNKLSAARCARMSYKPFDGDASYEREMERYDSLVKADRVHASPLEHQATPDEGIQQGFNITWFKPHLSGNLGPGWIQARKLVPNEHHKG